MRSVNINVELFMTKKCKYLFFAALLMAINTMGQSRKINDPGNPKVTDIWVVFKTHFDLGFTDLPENVFRRYREEMMDKALGIITENSKQPKEKQFAWTVSGWPLYAQILGPLQSPERKA